MNMAPATSKHMHQLINGHTQETIVSTKTAYLELGVISDYAWT